MKPKISIVLLSASVFLVHGAEDDSKVTNYKINPQYRVDDLSIDPVPYTPVPFPARFREPEKLYVLNQALLQHPLQDVYNSEAVQTIPQCLREKDTPEVTDYKTRSHYRLNRLPILGHLRSQDLNTRRTMVGMDELTPYYEPTPSIRENAAYLRTLNPQATAQINESVKMQLTQDGQTAITLKALLEREDLRANLPHPHVITSNNYPPRASEFVPAPLYDVNTDYVPSFYHMPAPTPLRDSEARISLRDCSAAHNQLDSATQIKMASLLLDELCFLEKLCPSLLANKDALWQTILDRIENQKVNASPEKLVELNAFQQFVLQRPFKFDAQDTTIKDHINRHFEEELAKGGPALSTFKKILLEDRKRISTKLPHPHATSTNNCPVQASDFAPAPINFDVIVDDVQTDCSLIPFAYQDSAPAARPLLFLPKERQHVIRGFLYDAVRENHDDRDFATAHNQLDPSNEAKHFDLGALEEVD